MTEIPPIPVRWVRRLREPDPATGLALKIVMGEIKASMLAKAGDSVSAAKLRASDCLLEARRYRLSAARVWSSSPIPMGDSEYERLTDKAKALYTRARSMLDVAEVWDEQAVAWGVLARAIENSTTPFRGE